VNGGRGLRARDVLRKLQPLSCQRRIHCPNSQGPLSLALTRSGQPRHPLYAPKAIDPMPFSLGRDRSNPPS
jgi:hypothetical protein